MYSTKYGVISMFPEVIFATVFYMLAEIRSWEKQFFYDVLFSLVYGKYL